MLSNKINWFPGHMKKATDKIQETLKFVDIVIEVVDARCINSSSNHELIQIIKNKHYLKIALKGDLADLNDINDPNVLIGSIYQKEFRNKIISSLNTLLEEKIKKLKDKGLVNPNFLVMVIGLPNVGKSSLINFLKKSNVLISQNYPGVTKTQRIVAINQNYNLIDTPGVFLKNIDDQTIAFKLGLIKCIKKEVLPIHEVLTYGFDYLNKHYNQELKKYYQVNAYTGFNDLFNTLKLSNCFLLKNNDVDEQKIYDKLYNDISTGKICKINYDK